ncbi:hypothetical protein EUGRSUZ_G02089 [Eucalyptus grandis]|uniref:Uncharacterized protein n=2 Tax=Eucalyptus grandis TaxID=71139 RepID=A0ACC3K5U0_EUCGR|nr:hypothetical protein EUGRSUZ_G02089 [Eucalyptus grandis]
MIRDMIPRRCFCIFINGLRIRTTSLIIKPGPSFLSQGFYCHSDGFSVPPLGERFGHFYYAATKYFSLCVNPIILHQIPQLVIIITLVIESVIDIILKSVHFHLWVIRLPRHFQCELPNRA